MDKQWSFVSPQYKPLAIQYYDQLPNQLAYMTLCFAIYSVPLFNLVPKMAQEITDIIDYNVERNNSSGVEFGVTYADHLRACRQGTVEAAEWNHPVVRKAQLISSPGSVDPVLTAVARLFDVMRIEDQIWAPNLLDHPFFFMATMEHLLQSPLTRYWADLTKAGEIHL